MVPEEERPSVKDDGRQPGAGARGSSLHRRPERRRGDFCEPYLSSVRAASSRQDHRDDARLPDDHGHVRRTPDFLDKNPKAAKALADSYFEAVEMIGREQAKAYEIMGADVKQTEQFGNSAKFLRWQDREANRTSSQASSRPSPTKPRTCARDRHHQAEAGHQDDRRHPVHSVSLARSLADRCSGRGARVVPVREKRAPPLPPGEGCLGQQAADVTPDRCPVRLSRSLRARVRSSAFRFSCLSSPQLLGLATLGGFVSKTFLADPITMLQDGWLLLTRFGFLGDIGVTVWRVVGGWVLAAIVAVPVGSSWAPTSPSKRSWSRSCPCALPAGLRLRAALDPVGRDRRDPEASGDLHRLGVPDHPHGRGRRRQHPARSRRGGLHARLQAIRGAAAVLIPANAPEIAEILRLVLGWAWTYVIVAELIGSSSGIGHMIIDSQALLATGQMIFGIIVIGLIGLVSDFLFKAVNRRLFAWRLA